MKTKEDLLKDIYGETLPFVFDYALPNTFCERIVETISAKTGENQADLYSALVCSVYAYGKGDINGQGFVPLSIESWEVLSSYEWISGINPFFVPIPKFSIRKGK